MEYRKLLHGVAFPFPFKNAWFESWQSNSDDKAWKTGFSTLNDTVELDYGLVNSTEFWLEYVTYRRCYLLLSNWKPVSNDWGKGREIKPNEKWPAPSTHNKW